METVQTLYRALGLPPSSPEELRRSIDMFAHRQGEAVSAESEKEAGEARWWKHGRRTEESGGAAGQVWSYAEEHANSLASTQGKGVPMHAHTRVFLARFYEPHNLRLATLLGDGRFMFWGNSSGHVRSR